MNKKYVVGNIARAVALGASLMAAAATWAQTGPTEYPRKPVTFVVGASPGGPADALTRLVTDRLKNRLGSNAVLTLDYKPGANGQVAGAIVAKAAPDGYTLLSTAAGHTVNPALYTNMPYDPLKDLVPVAFVAYSRTVIAVANQVPVRDLPGLIALSKSPNSDLSYASGGNGTLSHLLAELLLGSDGAKGARFTHVPYKSGTSALNDLMGGRVAFIFDSVQQLAPLAQDGRLKLLAITSDRRWPSLPDVPTMKEAGFPEATASSWIALFAPAKTPHPILERLNIEINAILGEPEVQANLMGRGFEHVPMTLDQASQFMHTEAARWRNVVQRSGIKVD